MRIAINTLSLYKIKVGMGRYIVELVNSVPLSDLENSYLIYASEHNRQFFNLSHKNVKYVIVSKIWTRGMMRIFWEQIVLPFSLWWNKINTYHSLGFVLPFFRLNKETRYVVTIADMTFFSHPEYHIFWKEKYFKCMIPISIKKADRVIAISENTKQDILKMIPMDENKIAVTYLGCDAVFSKQNKKRIETVLKKYKINFPYILFIGMLEPRKNIPALIKAFAATKEKKNHKLVIVGKKGWKYDEIFTLVQKIRLEKEIIFTGYISDEELPAFYSGATCFVYPSFYEGFGIPIIEAMACGCPVVTSNNSSMREIVGSAGLVVDPHNIQEIQDAISLLIHNQEIRIKKQREGIIRAKKFTWRTFTNRHVFIYNTFCSNYPS